MRSTPVTFRVVSEQQFLQRLTAARRTGGGG